MTPQTRNDDDEEKPTIQEYEFDFWEALRGKGKIIRQKNPAKSRWTAWDHSNDSFISPKCSIFYNKFHHHQYWFYSIIAVSNEQSGLDTITGAVRYRVILETVQFPPRWGHLTHQANIKSRMKYCHWINFSTFHKRAYAQKYKNIDSKRQRARTKSLFVEKRVSIASSWSNRAETPTIVYKERKEKEKLVWGLRCENRIALNSFFFTQFDRNFCRVKT